MRPSRGGTVDGDAAVGQLLAQGVDILDLIGQMAEIAPARIGLWVPIIGQFDGRGAVGLGLLDIARGAEEDQSKAPSLIVVARHLDQPKPVAIEVQRGL